MVLLKRSARRRQLPPPRSGQSPTSKPTMYTINRLYLTGISWKSCGFTKKLQNIYSACGRGLSVVSLVKNKSMKNLINPNNPVSEGEIWMFSDFRANSERDQILCQNM